MHAEPELPLTAAEVFNRALEIGDLPQRKAYLARVTAKTKNLMADQSETMRKFMTFDLL